MDWIWVWKDIQSNSDIWYFLTAGAWTITRTAFFHSFTGCDITSAMYGIGKNTAWNTWSAFPDITNTFLAITKDTSCFTFDSQYSACSAKTVHITPSTRQEALCLLLVSNLLNPSHQPRILCCSIQNGYCWMWLLSGISLNSLKLLLFLIQWSGVGNGMKEPRYGHHTGVICQTPAGGARFCFTVVVRLLQVSSSRASVWPIASVRGTA